MKICSKCRREKEESCFDKDISHTDGLRSWCKECRKAKWLKNREENLIKKKELYIRHRQKNLDYAKEYSNKNKELISKKRKIWERKPEVRSMLRNYTKKRREANPMIRLNASMRAGLYHSIKKDKNGAKWQSLVGYNLFQLKIHLEKLFQFGMTWNNYGKAWEIDHKIPLNVHNFKTSEHIDFKRAWDLKNLQPLWISQNRSKSGKINKPFQPSLLI